MRNNVQKLKKMGLTDSEIAKRLKIRIGKINPKTRWYESGSVRYYKHCINCIKSGRKSMNILIEKMKQEGIYIDHQKSASKQRHLLYPNLSSEIMSKINEKYPNLASKAGKKGGKIGANILHKKRRDDPKLDKYLRDVSRNNMLKLLQRRKNDPEFDEYLRNVSRITGKKVRKKYPELARNNMKKVLKRYGGTKLWKKWSSKGGKIGGVRCHQLHPTLAKENALKVHKLHPELSKELGKKYGRLGYLKTKKLYPHIFIEAGKKGGNKTIEILRNKKPFVFMGVHFLSNLEITVCKKFIEYGFFKRPIDGINCNVKVGSNIIDFRPIQNLFVEFHPWDMDGREPKEYFNMRRSILDNNGFQNCKLIVLRDLRKFDEGLKDFL